MSNLRWIIILLLHFSMAAAADPPRVEKPLVVASIRPLALLVEDLAGDLVDVDVLVTGQGSPHDFSLTIAQMMRLSDAKLLVWVGPKFEAFLTSVPHSRSLAMMEVESNALRIDGHDDHGALHVWLDIDKVSVFAAELTEVLVSLVPQARPELERRLAAYLKQIAEQDAAMATQLAAYREVPFVVFHDGYSSLVKRYGLNQVAKLTSVPHEQIGARQLVELDKTLANASCLLAESSETRVARRYANLLQIPLFEIDLLAGNRELGSFSAYLDALADSFVACLATPVAEK